MAQARTVRIVEVGPRDGLQNEPRALAADVKVALIERLVAAGCRSVEAGSFVSPRWVPQMADSAAVLSRLKRKAGVSYPVLVPNERGLDAALAAGARDIAVFASASESFSQANINCSIAESIERFVPVVGRAKAAGLSVRGYVSCVLGCPYEGAVAPGAVADVAARLHALGADEVSLGDTIGAGTPNSAAAMVDRVARDVPMEALAVHFHDTYGQALVNIHACLELGIGVVDASVGGLGGCPYAVGATGNVATEDLLTMLDGMGIVTGIDRDAVVDAALFICAALGREPASRLGALAARKAAAAAA